MSTGMKLRNSDVEGTLKDVGRFKRVTILNHIPITLRARSQNVHK